MILLGDRKITEVDIVSALNDTDYIFINQNSSLKQIQKSSITDKNKVNMPKDSNGTVVNGTAGQFAISDGEGGISWLTVTNGNEVEY